MPAVKLAGVAKKKNKSQDKAREARRREAERLAREQKAQRRRKGVAAVIVLGLVAALISVFFIGNDDEGAQRVTTDKGDSMKNEQPPGDTPCPPTDGSAPKRTRFSGPPPNCIDKARSYKATVDTDIGSFVIDLDAAKAPQTVNNFVVLSRYHFYDDVPFHRVIPGFVVQGGDGEKGDGTGGPGYSIQDELPAAGSYQEGSLAMANRGPNTAGSQFFVITGPQGASLPPQYPLFGKVVEGFDIVKKIEADGSPQGTPKVVHRIRRVIITES